MSVYTHVPLIVLSAFGKWFLRNRPASETAMYVSFITISKPNTECTRRYPVSRALISFQCFLALYGEKVLVAWLHLHCKFLFRCKLFCAFVLCKVKISFPVFLRPQSCTQKNRNAPCAYFLLGRRTP